MLAVTDTSQTTSGSETSTRTLSWDASGKLLSDSENTLTNDPATNLLGAHGVSDDHGGSGAIRRLAARLPFKHGPTVKS